MTIENLLVVHAWTGGLSCSPGSVTLRQWQQLATPKIEGLFESRPGVATRGDRKLDVEVENYNISDFEEDGETFYITITTELFLHNKDFLCKSGIVYKTVTVITYWVFLFLFVEKPKQKQHLMIFSFSEHDDLL